MTHISQETIEEVWSKGADKFIDFITDTYIDSIGGRLTAGNMDLLNTDQHTLLAYRYIKDEVAEGGFIQLIHNGYGNYIFDSPFPLVIKKVWGLKEFAKLIFNVKKEYNKHKDEIEADMSDEDFMALYENFEILNDYGDDFLDDFYEGTTLEVASYVKENIERFCTLS